MIYTKDEHKSLNSLISDATKCYKENDLYNKNSIKFIELNNLDLNSKNDLDLNKVDKSKILSIIYKNQIPNTIPLINNKKDGKGKFMSHVLNRFYTRQKNIYDNNGNIINTETFLDILKQYYQGILEIDNNAKNHLDKYNNLENLVLLIKKDNQLQYKLVVGRNVDNLTFYKNYSNDLFNQFIDIVGKDELDEMIDNMITDEMIINSLNIKSKYFQLRPFVLDLKTDTITIDDQKYQLENVDKLFYNLYMIYKKKVLSIDVIIDILINSCDFYLLNNTEEILDKLDLKKLLFKSHHWILSTIMNDSMDAKAQIQAVRTINEKNRIEDEVIENIILDEITNKILPILNKVKNNPTYKNVKEVLTLLNWNKKYIKENVNKQNYKEIFIEAGLETEIPIKSLNGSIIYTLKVSDYKIKDIEIESINYEKVSQSIKSVNIN